MTGLDDQPCDQTCDLRRSDVVVAGWRASLRRVDSDDCLAVAMALLVASAATSGVGPLSAVCGLLGIALAVPAGLAARSDRIAQIVAGLGLMWVVYGWLVGGTPSGSIEAVRAWTETEGRSLVVLGLIVSTRGLRRRATLIRGAQLIIAVVLATMTLALGLFLVGVDRVRGGDLFFGFTTSHHVSGFLACVTIIMLVVDPALVPIRWMRISAFVVLFVATVASGSRTSMFATLGAVATVVVVRRGVRSLLVPTLLGVLLVGAAFAGSTRLRQTGQFVVSGELFVDGFEAFTTADPGRAAEPSDSVAEQNILTRFRLWGVAIDQFSTSPIVGIGRYRVNDREPTVSGIDGFVAVVTDAGDKRHNDQEPHNVYLYLLVETGVLGLVWALTPFWLVWRETRPDPDAGDDPWRLMSRAGLVFAGLIGLVSVGVTGTGAGLITSVIVFGGAKAWAIFAAEAASEKGVLA